MQRDILVPMFTFLRFDFLVICLCFAVVRLWLVVLRCCMFVLLRFRCCVLRVCGVELLRVCISDKMLA